jgi:hypothetical protein
MATKQLVYNKYNELYFEWEPILQITDSLSKYIEELSVNKKLDYVGEIFKVIKNQIIVERFPDYLIGSAIKIYLKYKNARVLIDKTFT